MDFENQSRRPNSWMRREIPHQFLSTAAVPLRFKAEVSWHEIMLHLSFILIILILLSSCYTNRPRCPSMLWPLYQIWDRSILTGQPAYAFFLAYHTRISASVFELLIYVLPHQLFAVCGPWSTKALFRNQLEIFDGPRVIWACNRWLESLPRIIRFVRPWECTCLNFSWRSRAVKGVHESWRGP